MRPITQPLKDLLAQQFREQLNTEIDIYISVPTAIKYTDAMFAYLSNDCTYYSNHVSQTPTKIDCATFEQDFFTVGSSLRVAPKTNEVDQDANNIMVGLNIGEDLLLAPNNFVSPARKYGLTLRIEKAPTVEVNMIYIDGSSATNIYQDVEDLYLNTNEVSTFSIRIVPYANRRARVKEVVLGEILHYDNSHLMECTAIQYASALGDSLPYTELEFTVENLNHDYDLDNPTGLYNRIVKGQMVKARVSYGDIALDMFSLFLCDTPTVKNNRVSFRAKDLLSLLDYYIPPLVHTSGTGYFKRYVDEVLNGSIYEGVSFKPDFCPDRPFLVTGETPFNTMLQLFQHAWNTPLLSPDLGVIKTSIDGNIMLSGVQGAEYCIQDKEFVITKRDWKLDSLQADKQTLLKSVNVTPNSIEHNSFDVIYEDIINVYTSSVGNVDVEVKFNNGKYIDYYFHTSDQVPTVTVTGAGEAPVAGAELVSYTLYADRAKLRIKANNIFPLPDPSGAPGQETYLGVQAKITIKAPTSYIKDSNPYTIQVNSSGDDLNYSNTVNNHEPLCFKAPEPDRPQSFYNLPVLYSGGYMQDYRLQCGDVIYFDSPFTEKNIGFVEKLQFNLTSCWGAIQVRRLF